MKDKKVEIYSLWPTLQDKINAAYYTNDHTVTLDQNYTAGDSDDRLIIQEGKNVILDLNGFTLDRSRSSEDGDGHVIEVKGTLILTDSTIEQLPIGTAQRFVRCQLGVWETIIDNQPKLPIIRLGRFALVFVTFD